MNTIHFAISLSILLLSVFPIVPAVAQRPEGQAVTETPRPDPIFDETLGLWSQAPRPIPSTTGGPPTLGPRRTQLARSSGRLMRAAQLGRLQNERVTDILNGLRRLQIRDGSKFHGNFPWNAEDGKVTDTNAAFFIGLDLCALRLGYPEQFTAPQLAILDDLCLHLVRWFDREVPERTFHYPNKYLGDLVCDWMLHEILKTQPPAQLHTAMHAAADYWLANGWGWGEHLSYNYSNVIFNELGVLLSLSRTLPTDLQLKYSGLFAELVKIERAYAGGPRVPAIRSYAFTKRPNYKPFFERIKPWTTEDEVDTPYGHLLATRGLLERIPVPPPAANGVRTVTTPALGGAVAKAWIAPEARLGSLSHFPLMPEAEYPQWGLAWQSFPVCFVDGEIGWGFLRWRALENGIERGQPSLLRNNIYQLSDTTRPSFVGQTAARQSNNRVLAIRRMPMVSAQWDFLSDSIDFLGMKPDEVTQKVLPDGSQTLRVRVGNRIWRFGHHPLVSGAKATWIPNATGDGGRFEARWGNADLIKHEPPFRVAHLWWIAYGDGPDPVISRRKQVGPYLNEEADSTWAVSWPDTAGAWNLDIDLRASQEGALTEMTTNGKTL